MVKQLKRGQTAAVEYASVQPVDCEVVEKTLPYLKQQIQDMVMVQWRMGGRSQDVYNMRLCDIDRSKEIWVYSPFTYKTKKKDEESNRVRQLHIGPKAQEILTPYLEQCKEDPTQFVFVQCNGKPYTSNHYALAIANACKKAGVPHWSPNKLRHATISRLSAINSLIGGFTRGISPPT